ncbi:MAG: DUF4038 domain-containing protein [Parasporobacterium sp.]|nr:DUF4038 domain-containing protein [Parasporobacterium sp.]
MERIRVSENGRYLETVSGKPLIWIADTAWTLPQRMKWDDAEYYMQTRKRQGFTVLQICALDPERDVKMRNPAGEPALFDNDLSRPNEAYFHYLDQILDMAQSYGFYVLLLPVWGQLVTGDDWGGGVFEKIMTEENAYEYGHYIGNRYKSRPNLLWCLGGDRQPIHKDVDYRPVWRKLAEGLAKGITGQDLQAQVPDPLWQDLMITYHSCHEMETGECSTMSYWTDEEAWISFIMLQSGHGLNIKNWEIVKKEYDRGKPLPVWDGEPAYEDMSTSWPITPETKFHGPDIVRKRAYWSLLAGAFGYTYGHANVWCMISEKERNQVMRTDWYEAVHSEASGQIAFLRSFLEDLEAYNSIPCQEVLEKRTESCEQQHRQAAYVLQGEALAVYYTGSAQESLCLEGFAPAGTTLYGWWYNPRDGKFYTAKGAETTDPFYSEVPSGRLHVTTPQEEPEEDWILLLRKDSPEIPIRQKIYYHKDEAGQEKKVFAW